MDIIPPQQWRTNCSKEASKSKGLKLPLSLKVTQGYNALTAKEGKLFQVFYLGMVVLS